jgi:hypothetical protein
MLLLGLGMFHYGLSDNARTTLFATISCIVIMADAYISYKAKGTLSTNRIVLLCGVGLGTVFVLGQLSAYWQIFSMYSYTITTKNSPPTIAKARVVRSSSSGFIISTISDDNKTATIRFIPISELKEITADFPQLRW